MVWATGVGSLPGDDARDYAEAVRLVLGELGQLPYLPELPGRGELAQLTGRGCAVLAELSVDLQPGGWRLTSASGVDQRRARSLLAQDLDTMEELAQSHRGWFKIQLAGPWTLAATIDKPRGDKALADHGARREIAQSLAEGLGAHVRDVRRRLPHVDRLIVQLDEPLLPAVLAGGIPTFSGMGRHRAVSLAEASGALEAVVSAIQAVGAEAWCHACAPGMPYATLVGAGCAGFLVDMAVLSVPDIQSLAEALGLGCSLGIGVSEAAFGSSKELANHALRWLDRLESAPAELGDRLGVTGGCGWPGLAMAQVKQRLGILEQAAGHLNSVG